MAIRVVKFQRKGYKSRYTKRVMLFGAELSKSRKIRLSKSIFYLRNDMNIFSNLNSDCSNLLLMRNIQEQVKKVFC